MSWNRWPVLLPAVLAGGAGSAQDAASSPPADDIVVVAPAGDQRMIDRRVYLVKDNAQAQTETGLQLMRRLPSVTVNSEDQIQLLGDPKVKVLIDGHAVPEGARALKALPAGQIERIEVLTNPSAAYAADGTAGVINVITRRRAAPGLAGAATLTRAAFGGAVAQIAPAFGSGPWSINLSVTDDTSRFVNDVRQERTGADPAESYTALRHNDYRNQGQLTGHAEVGYRPSGSQGWTWSFDHEDADTVGTTTQRALSRGSALFPLTRLTRETDDYRSDSGKLAYSWTGRRQGESLSASAALLDWREPIVDRIDEDYAPGTQLSELRHENATRSAELKLDYVHPMRTADLLSVGGSLLRARKTQLDGLAVTGDHLVSAPFGPERISGEFTTAAAYATLQFPAAGWVLLPGARIEGHEVASRDFGAGGQQRDVYLFPSMHADRRITKRLDLSLSYSRRVEWPLIKQLDPQRHYYDPLDAEVGNPSLRPQLTDAMEATLNYKPGRRTFSLTIYDKETAHAWLTAASLLSNGVSLTSTVNLGSIRRLGGEVSSQGPLGRRLHYDFSVDLLARRSTVAQTGGLVADEQFTYDGNAQLQYQDKADGKPGANRIEFAASYYGPTTAFQQRTSGHAESSLTWTHSFTARLSSVVKVNDVLAGDGSTIAVRDADYRQFTRRLDDGRRVSASLVCRLGPLR